MKAINPTRIRRLLIRSPNWLGDAVMATPAMGDLRAFFPDAEITVAGPPAVAELFQPHPYCDRVAVLDRRGVHRGLMGRLRFAGGLRRGGFDLAVLFQNAFEAGVLAFLAGIPLRGGYSTDGRGFLLTHGVSPDPAARALHQVDYYRHLLRRLGIPGGEGRLLLEPTGPEIDAARARLGEEEWVALCPGAAYGPAKRWLPARFAQTAGRIARQLGAQVVLVGGPDDVETGQEIESRASHPLLNLIGRTTVREMMALMARCRLVVTNDSGPMHIAAALGVPIVALFGPTDPVSTSPLAETCRVIRRRADCAPCRERVCPADHRCMTAIEVDEVVGAAAAILEGEQ